MSQDASSPESRAAPQLCDRETEYPTSSEHVSPPSPCALQSSVWKHKADQDTTTEPCLLALGPDSTTTTCTSAISNLEPREVPATHQAFVAHMQRTHVTTMLSDSGSVGKMESTLKDLVYGQDLAFLLEN